MANSQDVRYPWRVGRKVGRTIYVVYGEDQEALIGMMDSKELAREAVTAHNAALLINDGKEIGGSLNG